MDYLLRCVYFTVWFLSTEDLVSDQLSLMDLLQAEMSGSQKNRAKIVVSGWSLQQNVWQTELMPGDKTTVI